MGCGNEWRLRRSTGARPDPGFAMVTALRMKIIANKKAARVMLGASGRPAGRAADTQ